MPPIPAPAGRGLAAWCVPWRSAVAAAGIALSACAVPVTAPLPPAAPSVQVVGLPGGGAEAAFRDGCRVRVDAYGRETGYTAACTREQRAYALRLVDARGREPGREAWTHAPQVVMAHNGAGRVRFADGCAVDYDRQGERRDRSDTCRRDQVREADRLMAAERRRLGLDDAGRAPPPEVVVSRNGSGRVVFRDGCAVGYDRDGERQGRSRECSDEQARLADRAMAAYRRELGIGVPGGRPGDGGSGTPAQVSVGPDGHTEVRVDRRCTVRYDVDGRRLDASPACDAAQLKAADRLEVRFRIGRLNQAGQGD